MIADIHIEGTVIAPELPAGGDVDGVKGDLVGVQHIRHLPRAGIELKVPRPVQAENLGGSVPLVQRAHPVCRRPVGIRDEIAAGRQLVSLIDGKRLIVAVVQLIFHCDPSLRCQNWPDARPDHIIYYILPGKTRQRKSRRPVGKGASPCHTGRAWHRLE